MNISQFRQQWGFYILHSLRDLRRNGARTVFALFCIATGVAAVVALRSLALMIGDELTLNLAEINRGDIQIVANDDISPRYFTKSIQNETVFSQDGVTALRQWANSQGVDIQFASNLNVLQLLHRGENGDFEKPISLIPILIEPEHWAYYGEVFTSEPGIKPLREWFPPGQKNIVISQRVALENELRIGDTVYAGENALTVAAFVEDETEGSLVLRNGAAGFIGYLYYPLDRAADLNLDPLPERAFVRIPLGTSVKEVDKSLERRFGKGISRITTDELAEQNKETADLVNDLILVMGLSSILIGGMGIINTMNVIVGRRTLEIAVLKTLGLKAWRVTTLFLVEAALMGIIGSLIGVLAGIILSYFVRGVGEEVLKTSLSWRAYPEAWYSGLSLGIVITVSFGFLPTLNAGQVRPAGVLRPNEIELPNAGLKRTLFAIIVVIVTFGLTLNTIVQRQIHLPIEMMLGLGGFIIGLFGGVMLANEGVMNIITPENAEQASRRAVRSMTVSTGAFLLVALGGMDIFLAEFDINPLMIYGIPLLVGGILYGVLKVLPATHLSIARFARQILLLGGALLLGAMVGGGIFALSRAVLKVLYPNQDLPWRTESLIVCGILGMTCAVGFRWRGRQAAGTVGLSLISAAVLAVIGFGIGNILNTLLGDTAFWKTIESWSVGIIVVEIIALALGGAFVVILGLVWLLSKTPHFGSVDLKLTMRNINARKTRTASTMIGLIVGVAALSLITLTTSGVTALLETQLETDIGGNVLVISRDPNTAEAVRKRLENILVGVNSYSQFSAYRGRIIEVNGQEPDLDNFQFGDAADGNTRDFGTSETEPGIGFAFTAVDPSNSPTYAMKSGRFFTAEDIGKPVMVLREPFRGTLFYRLGVGLGSTVTWLLKPPPDSGEEPIEITFTVIGIIDRDSEQAGVADTLMAPVGSIPTTIRPDSVVTIADIDEAHTDEAMIEFAQIPNAFAIEIGFIVQLAERLIDQLIAIPALVAVLALVAGIAIIANTVALDTQERRRQIGIMKAIGLKGYRVLGQLMVENGYTGLVAGLVGVGIGLVATILVGVLGDANQVGQTLKLMPAFRLVIMAILVSLTATLFAAWTAARESPMEVLRYE